MPELDPPVETHVHALLILGIRNSKVTVPQLPSHGGITICTGFPRDMILYSLSYGLFPFPFPKSGMVDAPV